MAITPQQPEPSLRDAAVPGRRAAAVVEVLLGDRTLGSKMFARNYREHKPWRRAGARKELDLRQVFPDLELSVEDAVESGDRVVIRWHARGTHKGEFKGIAPSGKTVDFSGINVYRFAGPYVVESWGQFDAVALQQQCQEIGPQVFEYLADVADFKRT